MSRYRKKPIEVEAWLLTKENIKEMYELINQVKIDSSNPAWEDEINKCMEIGLTIPTLEDGIDKRAKHVANIGDYIIKGIQGELYPCKPDIFEATYEKI